MKSSNPKTVVVTGASSGIGKASVSRLIDAGWRVFATVRKSVDGQQLRAEFGANLIAVRMDLSDHGSIDAAAEQIFLQLHEQGLDGLVNVAGVGMVRPIEYITTSDLEEIFEINVFAQIGVTQALLPLIRKTHGRIINITSVGAHIPIPFGSLLSASKSAFGIFSDTLRSELRPFGIRVCTVEPGAIKTPAVKKTLGDIEGVIRALPPAGAAQYAVMLRQFARRAYEREINGSSPDGVARTVYKALTAQRPRRRYHVGKHATVLSVLPKILPDRVLEAILLRLVGMPTKFGAASPGNGN